jgi:hypothetical protein
MCEMEKNFDIGVCDYDFEHCIGRKPKNEDEFLDFVHDCKKAIEGQIDWDIIFEVVKEDWKD